MNRTTFRYFIPNVFKTSNSHRSASITSRWLIRNLFQRRTRGCKNFRRSLNLLRIANTRAANIYFCNDERKSRGYSRQSRINTVLLANIYTQGFLLNFICVRVTSYTFAFEFLQCTKASQAAWREHIAEARPGIVVETYERRRVDTSRSRGHKCIIF